MLFQILEQILDQVQILVLESWTGTPDLVLDQDLDQVLDQNLLQDKHIFSLKIMVFGLKWVYVILPRKIVNKIKLF